MNEEYKPETLEFGDPEHLRVLSMFDAWDTKRIVDIDRIKFNGFTVFAGLKESGEYSITIANLEKIDERYKQKTGKEEKDTEISRIDCTFRPNGIGSIRQYFNPEESSATTFEYNDCSVTLHTPDPYLKRSVVQAIDFLSALIKDR